MLNKETARAQLHFYFLDFFEEETFLVVMMKKIFMCKIFFPF